MISLLDMADAESFFLTSVVCDTTPQYIQISKIIKQDIDRAYPEMDFFRQNWVKQSLYRILYIYAHVCSFGAWVVSVLIW